MVEVEEVSGAPEVSVPVAHGGHSSLGEGGGGGPWHLLAWLRLLCLISHLPLGHGVICPSLLPPLIDLTPSCRPGTWRIKTGVV